MMSPNTITIILKDCDNITFKSTVLLNSKVWSDFDTAVATHQPVVIWGLTPLPIAYRGRLYFHPAYCVRPCFDCVLFNNKQCGFLSFPQCALIINDWMTENKLKMNASKTEFIMFGSRQQLDKCVTTSINIANDNIKKSAFVILEPFLTSHSTSKNI